jgi:hypothetical protein
VTLDDTGHVGSPNKGFFKMLRRAEQYVADLDPFDTTRPKLSYGAMCALAIQDSPGERATLSGIYEYIAKKFPYYGNHSNSKGWQNSIRHNLSLNKAFIRQKERDDGGKKGGTWSINSSINTNPLNRIKVNSFPNSFREQEDRRYKTSVLNESINNEEPVTLSVLTPAKNHTIICDNSQERYSDHETNEFMLFDLNEYAADENIPADSKCDIQCISGLDEFRRKSVEDYLEMSNSILEPNSNTKKYPKASSRHKKINESKVKNNKN